MRPDVSCPREALLDLLVRPLLDRRGAQLYDNRLVEASYEPGPDGTYAVNVEVESRKFRADGEGVETEVPVDDWIDIAVFGEREPGSSPDGKLLALEKRKIDAAETVFEIVVDEEPRRAGIDPFTKLIDRNPDNNVSSVSAGGGS